MEKANLLLTVSDFIALTNQTLEYAYPNVEIEGEVAGFKTNQGKYVFFDLKDESGSVGCFMMLWQLRMPVEDGMKVIISAAPKLTPWGKFSLTVRAIRPSGEGSLKKSFELLKAKLEKEGLFSPERKRALPIAPTRVGVISSTQAAGYSDFIKILNDRWGGMNIEVANVQVQGSVAADQIIRALQFFNEREQVPDVVVIVRGGGSADDLSAFNDELLVREIASSRVPTLIGVGHETDTSLSDLVADVRAATPSNAAQLLVPDRNERIRAVRFRVGQVPGRILQTIERDKRLVAVKVDNCLTEVERQFALHSTRLESLRRVLGGLDPQKVLMRGYALVRGVAEAGRTIEIETKDTLITAEVKYVEGK